MCRYTSDVVYKIKIYFSTSSPGSRAPYVGKKIFFWDLPEKLLVDSRNPQKQESENRLSISLCVLEILTFKVDELKVKFQKMTKKHVFWP